MVALGRFKSDQNSKAISRKIKKHEIKQFSGFLRVLKKLRLLRRSNDQLLTIPYHLPEHNPPPISKPQPLIYLPRPFIIRQKM